VLLEISKEVEVPAAPDACWQLINDVPRLSGCIPGVSDVREVEPGQQYTATVTDKLGPFRLQLPVTIAVQERDEPRKLVAELRGNDGRGQARVQGRLEASLEPTGQGTRFGLSVRMEVLGRLASLGATPMRRRTDEIFAQFARSCREGELSLSPCHSERRAKNLLPAEGARILRRCGSSELHDKQADMSSP